MKNSVSPASSLSIVASIHAVKKQLRGRQLPLALWASAAFLQTLSAPSLSAQTPPFFALGDSLGEGVQSAIASDLTQPHGLLNLMAIQMGVPFPLPLLSTTFYGVVNFPAGRSRENPGLLASDLAVSGATSGDLLNTVASLPATSETSLVLAPRIGYTQISSAEAIRPPFMVCEAGTDDILGAVLNFDHLDGSQITPAATFAANYSQITSRLAALGSHVVYANIRDLTALPFLFSADDLQKFLGSSYGLPSGSYTTLIAMFLIKLGLVEPTILQNPDWVLDPGEIATINTAVSTFNQIIEADAAQVGAPVVDVYGMLAGYAQNPLTLGGVTLTSQYLGGMQSLDGVLPSDIAYALIANAFISTADSFYGMEIPQIDSSGLLAIMNADPFVDFNGSLQVRGRPLNGLLETLGPILGISGNASNVPGSAPAAPTPGINPAAGVQFMQQYFMATGKAPNTPWSQQDAINAMKTVFGLSQ